LHNARGDQAAGLRRLCGGLPRQVINIAAANRGAGRTTFVIGLALALAALGRRVLVIDENSGIGNINDRLGLGLRYDLWHVLCDGRRWTEVAQPAHPRISVLPAARAARMWRSVPSRSRAAALAQIAAAADVVLVDAAPGSAGGAWEIAGEARHWVLLPTGAAAVTAAYALIKRIARSDDRRIEVVVAGARSAAEGAAIHANLAAVARRYLKLTPALSGVWAADHAAAAALCAGRGISIVDAEHPLARCGADFASRLVGVTAESMATVVEPWLTGSRPPKLAAAAWGMP